MKNKVNFETWLPLFPGFYNTQFSGDGDEEQVFTDIADWREENGLAEIDDLHWAAEIDYTQYQHDVSVACVEAMDDFLSEIGITAKVIHESVYSPKEYNFTNDSINVQIEFPEGTQCVSKLVHKHYEEVAEMIRERHTSYDGFMSWHSNNIDNWKEDTDDFTDFTVDMYKLGAILEMLLQIEGYSDDSLYYATRDADTYFTSEYITNWETLTESDFCEECEEFFSDTRKAEYEKQKKRDMELYIGKGQPEILSYQDWVSKVLGDEPDACPNCMEEVYNKQVFDYQV